MRRAAVILGLLWLLQTGWAAGVEGWTADEPTHLRWSARLWSEGVAERTSYYWFDSKTPITLAHVFCEHAAERAGLGPRAIRFAARLPSVAFGAGVLLLVFLLGRRLLGERGACLAVAGCALDPSLIAHSSLATVDAAFACATMSVLLASVRFMSRPSPDRAAVLGLAFGFALTAKFAALFLVPGLMSLLWVSRWHDVAGTRTVRARLASMGVAGLTALTVLAAAYLFLDVGTRMDAVQWASAPARGLAAVTPWLRLPVPQGLLTGLDLSLARERRDWNVVLLGRLHPSGVWYYFGFLWLIKTPVLLLGAQAFGFARGLRKRTLLRSPGLRLIALNLVVLLGYFSFVFRTQVGYRYVLMCLPLAYLLAAAGLDFGENARWPRRIGLLVVAASLAEGLAYLGNPISFSNSFVWPKRDAYRLMADSNLDWGQNDDDLPALLARHGAAHTLLNPLHLLPGRNTFRVNDVAGVADFEQHRWLREHVEPVAQIGHTYLRFDIDPALFSRFMDEARTVDPAGAGLCPDEGALAPTPAGARVPVDLAGTPDPERMWVACVSVDKSVDVALRALDGHARFGPRGPNGCRWETVEADQVSWWRLKPGLHALCLDDIPNRRPWLPYHFGGVLIVRGRPVRLQLSERAVPDGDRVPPSPP
jgi:hypothetical protein